MKQRPVASRLDASGRQVPAWVDAPPRLRASTLAAPYVPKEIDDGFNRLSLFARLARR